MRRRLMLIGPSRCGKTSLLQALEGISLHDQKTQAIEWRSSAIDTPGEYLENRCLYSALMTTACEADVVGLMLNADASQTPYAPRFAQVLNRPVIGIVSKADLGNASDIARASEWLREAGAGRVFVTSARCHEIPDGFIPFLAEA
ncbi:MULTISPECIES: EutP/PduV family microcompartment system protein [Mangrovibacter]|uniref:Ethanolamine utilization protein EutP n=1 Tax=Mangrovibacter plantisponsor TaxID=451513 RepID=A0A317Q747_9ENTR|nr:MULTISPECIES: EutP/PduV family microcompartment system protein [Mangrovibacter]PWW11570.1 ethanolamine utilization protein EutP [Mangrovibacter plantisponsor]